ncbi:hypothetical protein DUI87_25006 [Hirundo rustica rustica]|uniref:PP4R4 phosphatase n=1 Tax=Hirundo rustica rustica TaxID=333673 RepID=A0A3M0JC94_HIRRU|nr:hypothetical protein DUI87_25006 [Hirundo rustica rustica]
MFLELLVLLLSAAQDTISYLSYKNALLAPVRPGLVPLASSKQLLLQRNSGQDIQGTSVVANLPVLMRQNPAETLRRVLPKIRILNPLVSKAQLSQTLQSRLVSCKIMGKVANKFEAHIIKREVLPLVKSLCQDVEYEVRTCMCRQLEHVARGIGTELTKTVVLPELVELARDEGSSVRLAAFETLVNLLDMFDADDRSQTVLPLVKSFCEKSFKADESILVSLSFHLGKLCNGLYGIFTPEQHLRFLEFYKKLSTLGLQQENGHNDNQLHLQTLEQEKKYISVRKNCAYNFPAMIVFVDPKNFHLELYSIFFCLCHDPEVSVRYTMAISFFEVAKLLNSDVYTIHKELVTLLQDESLENVLPVQKAAARTLCVYLRYNRKQEQRHEVIQKLIEQLGQGKSYWNRLRFLDTCEFIMELFSKSFFCKYFFLPVLELTHDPVANVRMKLCCLLPKVKSTLKIPTDKHLLQQLELCIRKLLCQEKDKDVLTIVKRTVLELDRMEISVDAEQLEKEKQKNEGRSTNINDKIFEKKRRDSKTSSVLAKSINLSISGSSSGTSAGKNSSKLNWNTLILHHQDSLSKLHLCVSDDSLRTHSAGNSGNAAFPSSCSRNLFNSADQKNNGNKESQSRRMSM